jgi:hypothetical protein
MTAVMMAEMKEKKKVVKTAVRLAAMMVVH